MTYEEEQIKYAEEFKANARMLEILDEIFKDPSQINAKIWELYNENNPFLEFQTLSKVEIQQYIMKYRLLLEEDYRIRKARQKELERLLSQTPDERKKENVIQKIDKTADYIAGITPQHVSGNIYRVEDGDGCGTFCLWFLIIDSIIVFIIYLIIG